MWTWLLNNIGLVVSVACFIITIVYTVIKLARKGVSPIDILKGVADVVKQFPDFVRLAEKVSKDPEVKKTFALNQVVLNCQAKGITPTEQQLAEWSMQIDELVKLTKELHTGDSVTNTKPTTTNIEIKPIQTIGGEKLED